MHWKAKYPTQAAIDAKRDELGDIGFRREMLLQVVREEGQVVLRKTEQLPLTSSAKIASAYRLAPDSLSRLAERRSRPNYCSADRRLQQPISSCPPVDDRRGCSLQPEPFVHWRGIRSRRVRHPSRSLYTPPAFGVLNCFDLMKFQADAGAFAVRELDTRAFKRALDLVDIANGGPLAFRLRRSKYSPPDTRPTGKSTIDHLSNSRACVTCSPVSIC